jgi:hypothetical protein
LVTDITIWNAPLPPARFGGRGVAAPQADVTGQRAGDEFTDADYVPVNTYLKTARAVVRAEPATIDMVPAASDGTALDFARAQRAQSAIRLYTSIFNYRHPPPDRLCVRV